MPRNKKRFLVLICRRSMNTKQIFGQAADKEKDDPKRWRCKQAINNSCIFFQIIQKD